MVTARVGLGLVASCLLVWGDAARAVTVADVLNLRPKQPGVNYSTPKPDEQASCKLERITGNARLDGWVLRDAQGRILRRFLDTNRDGHVDVYSYYLDGVEVYRETDTNYDFRVDQYRWLNSAGMKWGVSSTQNGTIDQWKMISAEEASQEILQALIANDFSRLQALWITDAEIKALGLSPAETARLQTLHQQAPAKFQDLHAKLTNLTDQTHWVHLEAPLPQCVPAEQTGGKQDLLKQRGSILYETAGKTDVIGTGEMILVGQAWRLVDVPTAGDESAGPTTLSKEFKDLLDQLKNVDDANKGAGDNAAMVRYNLDRAAVLEKIVALKEVTDREQWVRQIADCLSAAAQGSPDGDKGTYQRLMQYEQQVVHDQPGSALAAYVTYREMSASNAGTSMKDKDTQEKWMTRLAKFVQDYPQAEDTPDALMQLGMLNEFVGSEIKAKNWYKQLSANFPNHDLAAKAQGALRRLEIEGQVLELTGPRTDGGTFELSSLRGKVVAVYYWAGTNPQCIGDCARLKVILDKYKGQGLELVCVNLDNSPPTADSIRATGAVPGIQLYQPGGTDSALAKQYGIMVLPNMFLVGKDGKVVSRTVQVATLEDELKKLLK
jgi:peroxiredoxin